MTRCISATILAAVASAHAVSLSVDGATGAALAGDRDLRAARALVAAARERAQAAGRLSDPEFDLEIAGGKEFEGRIELGLSQRFPLTARLRLEKELSELEVAAAACEVEIQERAIVTAVREACFRLLGERALIAQRRRQAELAGRLRDVERNRVSEGLSSSLDADLVSLEASEAEIAVADARAESVDAERELSNRLGLPFAERIEVTTPIDLPDHVAPPATAISIPAVRLAEIAVESAGTDARLARALGWEDFALGFFVEGERFPDEPEGIEPEGLLGMRLSVPLPLWRNTRAEVRSRENLMQARIELLEGIRLAAANDAAAARRRMEARFESATAIRNRALPAARALVENAEAAHQRGEIGIQDVLRIRARVTNLEVAAIQSAIEYHIEHARWMDASGSEIIP